MEGGVGERGENRAVVDGGRGPLCDPSWRASMQELQVVQVSVKQSGLIRPRQNKLVEAT